MRRGTAWAAVLAIVAALARAQAPAPLTNADIVGMVHAGVGAGVVAAKVRTTPGEYDTSPAALVALTRAGVPETVITEMVAAGVPQLAPAFVYITADASAFGTWRFLASGNASAPAREPGDPQRDELVKNFLHQCPAVPITTDPARATYALEMQREPDKPYAYARKKDKWQLSRRDGRVLAAGSDRELANVAKDACHALQRAAARP